MNYTLHQLQVFLEVVRQESITQAANELHLTQPAVSIQMKNFQMQFSIPLTEVVGKQLYITDFGRSIAEIAENIISEADAIKYKTKEYEGILAGKLRISSASTGKYVMPYFMSGFLKKHRAIDLVLDVTNKTKVISSLKSNEIDFALVSVLPDNIPVNEERLLENKIFLVGKQENYEPELPLIFREEGSATRKAMDQYFSGQVERKSMELTSNEAVKQAVIAGLGYSMLPLIGIKHELAKNEVYVIPSENLPIVTEWRLIWLKNKKLSPLAKAYLEYIREEKEKIIASEFKWYLDYNIEDYTL